MKISQTLESLNTGTSQSKGLGTERPDSAGAKTPQVTQPAPAADSAASGSSLKLSDLSSKLQQIESKLTSGDAFDAARVSEIKQSISDGSFKVNSGNVADKLLSGARDLFVQRH